ncbi:MAG: insulinase family protein [candidate division KSB1 bacterium]|nr:insulinase family protein [candidate division KSB1 bacterium]MDZ7334874.1 insulinase family protein [candidate division KSB1 bacterium]MDZ7357348.1 insulinase family protein [candidate division KSB1 bacterium]MDZ7399329.1 insulinase family protein [candidate division KSB1 bacterium]
MLRKTPLSIFVPTLLLLFLLSLLPMKSAAQEIDIPYEKFVLDNGLTVIIHEDHKAPIVAVNIWYHVGSKNEKPGKTGFAHLFEHLMFNGSEHYNDDYFKPLEKVGATDLNGTTNEDRTNYFQNVPISAFDLALWMESDRMGHLIGAIDQAKLDEQRGVVQNEKRQYENQPYSIVDELVTKNCFPAGHPYSWTVIGSMEDLDAASLEDVHEWFKTYYGAANAVISIAGDVDTKAALEKVKYYFGSVPSGPPVAKHKAFIAKRTGTIRQSVEDRVPQARIYKVWNVPQWGTPCADYLDLVSDVLASGKTSRLYKRLVYEDQIATDVASYIDKREIASLFYVQATAKPGEDLKKVEKALDEELKKFLDEGPTEAELKRVKSQFIASFVRGIERIGGFGGKSDILATNEVFGGSPDYYKTTLKRVREATAQNLLETAKRWLSDGVYILEVHPFPSYQSSESKVDRSKLPEPGPAPEVKFPKLQRATLSNGLKLVLAERHAVPIVNFNLLVDAGYAADQFGLPGTASLAMDMLDEGTKTRDALQISEELALLGARLSAGSSLDMSSVYLSTLKENLDASLNIFADVILNPAFPEKEFARLQKQQLARIKQEKASPFQMALRVFPRFLYGEGHAYGNSFTGSGTEQSVNRLTTEDLAKFHQTWFKPNNATLVIVGDTKLSEITPKLEKLFAGWKPGNVPKKNISPVDYPSSSTVYLIDKPGSPQSVILAGHIAPPKADADDLAMNMLNSILGGTFTSRINMNLREAKHWSYGAGSVIVSARGQRPFIAYTSIQGDKTKESLQEMKKEMMEILGARPATPEELDKVLQNEILGLPGSWETIGAVGSLIAELITYGLPDDYYQTYPEKLRNLKLNDISRAAKKLLRPNQVTWIVVGDRAKVEPTLKELGFGEVRLIDADGKPVE